MGIRIIAPSDTVGSSTPEAIETLISTPNSAFPQVSLGLICMPGPAIHQLKYRRLCGRVLQRIDGALRGFGGCPMAADELTGNLPTEEIIETLSR